MTIILKILIIFIMTVSGTFGALFFKKGIAKMRGINIFSLILVPEVYLGVAFYLIGAVTNIILLRYISYTVLYPMTSLTYIWTMVISFLVLKEKINRDKVIAVLCIIMGVIVLGFSK